MNLTTTRPATEKQFAFIKSLLEGREVDGLTTMLVTTARERAVKGTLSSRQASDLIDILLDLPKKTASKNVVEEPKAGIYWIFGDHLVRVYFGQQSGHMLVKRINFEQDGDEKTVSYEYLGVATKILTPGAAPSRLTLEEVKELSVSFGLDHDHCMICGRPIDVPESTDRGIGPVCAEKY